MRRRVHPADRHALDEVDVGERCRHDDLRHEPLQAILCGFKDVVLSPQHGAALVTGLDEARTGVLTPCRALRIGRSLSRLSFLVQGRPFFELSVRFQFRVTTLKPLAVLFGTDRALRIYRSLRR